VDVALFAELKRRRLFRALVGYGIAAFAVLQIIEPIMHGLHWPDVVLSYVVVALAAGFPVVVALAWIFDVRAGRIERTPGPPLRARFALALVGIGVLAAAPGLVWYFIARRAPVAVAPSIAVLPFADMSPGKDQEYFSDGIAEEILDALAQVEGLRAAGRTSSFSFKGKSEDLGAIAEKLHVAHVLEGSVRKEANRVRITAQLIAAADGYHVWSKTFERELTGVFAVQDEIAAAVVEAMKLKLLAKQRVTNPEAYAQYLLAKELVRQHPNRKPVVAAYARSIALDPGHAPSWAALSTESWSCRSRR
jgi:TolB-like protein